MRFSNICNFKCRTCNAENSTLWYDDELKIKSIKHAKVLTIDSFNPKIFDELDELIPFVKYIYFAGGEPLLDKNHYLFLEKLILQNRTDIVLSYNTNLSTLMYQNWNALELWQKFKNVKLSISIDAIADKLELIRKGSNWNQIQKNLKLLLVFCPHILIEIYPTVSVLNCYHLPELILYFLLNNYIKTVENINLNILNDPFFLNIGLMNSLEIENLSNLYSTFIESLKNKFKIELVVHIEKELERVLSVAKSLDLEKYRLDLITFTNKIDAIRNENSQKLFTDFQLQF